MEKMDCNNYLVLTDFTRNLATPLPRQNDCEEVRNVDFALLDDVGNPDGLPNEPKARFLWVFRSGALRSISWTLSRPPGMPDRDDAAGFGLWNPRRHLPRGFLMTLLLPALSVWLMLA